MALPQYETTPGSSTKGAMRKLRVCLHVFALMLFLGGCSHLFQNDAESPTGQWSGSYSCIQGKTALILTMEPTFDDRYQALFHFRSLPGDHSVPEGCFTMDGLYDRGSGRLVFLPRNWVRQPLGYITVGLNGIVDPAGQHYNGQITGGLSCSTFELQRSHMFDHSSEVCSDIPNR